MKVPSYQPLLLDYDKHIARIALRDKGVTYLYTVPASVAWARSYIEWERDDFIRKWAESRRKQLPQVAEY